METLLLLASFIVPVAAGFLLIRSLDRFLSGGAVRPYWNREAEREEEQAEAARAPEPVSARSGGK